MDEKRAGGRGPAIAGLAAIGSMLAASSCCLPVVPFFLAAGFAGASTFLAAARPYLMGASVLFVAFGFYQGRRAKACGRRGSRVATSLLWLSAAFVAVSIFFPQAMANAVADLAAR